MNLAVFHSIKQKIYHNKVKCVQGTNIEEASLRYGTGGKPLCPECKGMSKAPSKMKVFY